MDNRKKNNILNIRYKCKICGKNVYKKYSTCPRCGYFHINKISYAKECTK